MVGHPSNNGKASDKHAARQFVTYPRIYLPRRKWKAGQIKLGLALALPCAVGIVYFGSGHGSDDRVGMVFLTATSLAFFLAGLYCVARALMLRLTLYADAIEQTGLLGTLRVPRSEIGAYRTYYIQGEGYIELQPGPAGGKTRSLRDLFKWDHALRHWFEGIPNKSVDKYTEAVDDVEKDESLGATVAERLARAGRGRKVANALSWVTWLAVASALLFYRPAMLPVYIVLPWLALALRYFLGAALTVNLFTDDTQDNLEDEMDTGRGHLLTPLFTPSFILLIVAFDHAPLLQWTGLILPAALGTVLMLGAVMAVAPELRGGFLRPAVVALALLPYPGSLLAIADVYCDQAPAQNIVLNVKGKDLHVGGTYGGFRTYYFYLPRWGSDPQTDVVDVSRSLYHAVKPGQQVCIHRHPGWLHMAWYEVKAAAACHAPGVTTSR